MTSMTKTTDKAGKQATHGSFPHPLAEADEARYIAQYKSDNKQQKKEAKDALVAHNLRLVAHIVKKYNHPDTDDLISIGTIGLIKGIDHFDSSKNTKLSTFCSRCIENAMLFWVTHITPFLFLRKICVCFRAFQEDVYDVALYDYAL